MSTDLPALAPFSGETSAVLRPQSAASGDPACMPVESSPSPDPASKSLAPAVSVKKRLPRIKAPKDSKVYKVVLAIVALRAQGVKAKEISETLGYSEEVIRQYVSRAHKKGWINIQSFSDVDDQLEYILKHKVVRNINEAIDARDKDVTLEAAKGLGLFKTHQVVKNDIVQQVGVALSVSVVMPPEAKKNSLVTIRPGTTSGTYSSGVPLDAEIIEPEE